MSSKNRAIFDGREISESELETTDSEDFSVYVAERIETETDEVHIFPKRDSDPDYGRVHESLKQLSADPDQTVSEIHFQCGIDGRLILSVGGRLPQECSPGQEVADYLKERI